MRFKFTFSTLFFLAILFILSPLGLAYEEIDLPQGGTLQGKVTLRGAVPEPRIFPLVLYPFGPFCKKISDGEGNVRLKEFVVSADGGLSNAVVAVEAVPRGKHFEPIRSQFVAVDCMFHPAEVSDDEQYTVKEGKLHHEHPLVTVLENHRPISMINKDPVIHNIQVFQNEKGNIILNTPLPVSTEPRGGILNFAPGKRVSQMICGMHEFMQSWGFVVDNPYYAKTKKDGGFSIDRLPPGTYKVIAWHPHFKIIEKEITVPENGTIHLDFEFDAQKVERPIYEMQKDRRISPATPHNHLLQESDDRIIME